jgi:hypothetical protein
VPGSHGGGTTRTCRPAHAPSHAGARRVTPIHVPCMCMSLRALAHAWGEGARTRVPWAGGQRRGDVHPGHGGEGGMCAGGQGGPDPRPLASLFGACAPGWHVRKGGEGTHPHAPLLREWGGTWPCAGGLVPGGACAPGGGMGDMRHAPRGSSRWETGGALGDTAPRGVSKTAGYLTGRTRCPTASQRATSGHLLKSCLSGRNPTWRQALGPLFRHFSYIGVRHQLKSTNTPAVGRCLP